MIMITMMMIVVKVMIVKNQVRLILNPKNKTLFYFIVARRKAVGLGDNPYK